MQVAEQSAHSVSGGAHRRHLKGVEWSDEDVRTLIELWKGKQSFAKIARQIGRSRKAVIIKACRLGLTARPYWNDAYVANARRRGTSRRCLSCRCLFFSEGPGNRICLQCKERQSWNSGSDLAGPAD